MKRFLFVATFIALLLSACGSAASPATMAVENYLQALSDKQDAVMLSYVCPDFEQNALIEFDAYGLVQTTLKDLSCKEAFSSENSATVVCSGSIEATYGSELRSFDLSERTYNVVNDGGNWLVCGYTK